MAETLNCPSCGAANQLPEGRTSMFCAFCATAIEKKIQAVKPNKKNESSIKTKPIISPRKTQKRYTTDVNAFSEKIEDRYKLREYEEVTDAGGELSLKNRNIKSLREVIEWFSDNELEEITILNLSNNQIEDFEELNAFKNVEYVHLENNKINKYPNSIKLDELIEINLENNFLPENPSFKNWEFHNGTNIILQNGILTAVEPVFKGICKQCGKQADLKYDVPDWACLDCNQKAREASYQKPSNLVEFHKGFMGFYNEVGIKGVGILFLIICIFLFWLYNKLV